VNVLFLVPKAVSDQKMARERFAWMRAVQEQVAPHGVHTTGPGWPDWQDDLTPVDNLTFYLAARKNDREAQPHLVVPYEVEGLRGAPIPVCLILQEAYNRPKTLRLLAETDPKIVVFTYANEMLQYQAELEAAGRQVWNLPHCADDSVFVDQGRPRIYDVLIVGNMNQTVYPFRNRLARLAWRGLRKRGYRVKWLPHPGYVLPPKAGGFVGAEYAALLGSSKLVVTCTSRYRYALCKLAEIPLCGALPVSDLPYDRQKFFSQTLLHVEPWMLDAEIQQAMEDVLDDEDEWRRRVKLAHDKIEARLLMKFWAERFIYWGRRFLGEAPTPPTPLVGDEDT
jgi:hypothetical protein